MSARGTESAGSVEPADVEAQPDAADQESDGVGDESTRPARPTSSRMLVLVGAMLVMLLVGAAGGAAVTLLRNDAAAAPGASSVDVGFAQDMRVHHLQAVTMAGIERDRTTDPVLRGIAFDIESTQLAQSSEMAGWLTVWGQPNLPSAGAGHMGWMSGGGMAGHGGASTGAVQRMPGMATTDELNQLRKLSGRELDVLFLQLMLRHHQGGLEMSEYAAEHAGEGYVRNLAAKIVTSQQNEATLMTKYLEQRGAEPLPHP